MRRPNIGIFPESAHHSELIFRWGGLPVSLTEGLLRSGIDAAVASLNGLWLTGESGASAGGEPLVRAGLSLAKPLLVTGAGLRLMNRVLGGTELEPPVSSAHRSSDGAAHHPVEIEEGTVLASAVGPGELMVNATPGAAPHQLGDGARSSARSYEGVIEAVELSAPRFAIGVRWEPHRLVGAIPAHRGLFDALISASRK